MFEYITDEAIDRLAKYKFQAGTYTPLDNLLNPFWLRCQEFLPRCVSPNMVTLFGAFCAFVSMLFIIFGQGLYRWPYLLAASLLFVYQTADAVDGKHARITQQSTPLGGLVDHGVDAFVGAIMGIAICSVLDPQLSDWWILFGFNAFISTWFMAQWKYYKTGVFSTVGITEGEFLSMAFVGFPGVLGVQSRYSVYDVTGHPRELRELMGLGVGYGCSLLTVCTILEVMWRTKRPQVVASLLPLVLHHITSAIIFLTSHDPSTSLVRFSCIATSSCSLMTKMVISSVTHTPWPLVHIDALPFVAVAISLALGFSIPSWVFTALLAWQVLAMVLLWHDTIVRICARLKIPFLSEVPHYAGPRAD